LIAGRQCLGLSLLFALAVNPARAAGDIWGIGSTSCNDVLSANDRGDRAVLLAAGTWAQGYLSAVNASAIAHHDEPLPFAEPRDIMLYITTYCFLNRSERVVEAVEAFKAHEQGRSSGPKRP